MYVKWKRYNNRFNSWPKNVTHVDTSSFALKTNLANLKTEVDKLDIDKLVLLPITLSKLSDVVKMMLLKKLCMIKWLQK